MKKISHKKTVERPCLECRLAFRLSAKEKQEIEAKAKHLKALSNWEGSAV